MIQRAPESIITQVRKLFGRQAIESSGEAVRGLLLTVDRFAFHHDRAQEHTKGLSMRHRAALVVRRDVLVQERFEPHALEEVVDEG